MKTACIRVILCCLTFGMAPIAHSQTGTTSIIRGVVSNAPGSSINFMRPAWWRTENMISRSHVEVKPNSKGEFSIEFTDIVEPEIILAYGYDASENLLFRYNFFVSRGDNLVLKINAKRPASQALVTGTGSANNQYLDINDDDSTDSFYKDTLPDRVIGNLMRLNKAHKQTLESYIKEYRPSQEFIDTWNMQLQYEVLQAYYSFEHNNAFGIRKAYQRNFDKWYDIRKQLVNEAPVDNPQAVAVPNYRLFMDVYILRTKESLWERARTDRANFLTEWYGKDTTEGALLYFSDNTNDLKRRIIDRNFTGAAKELAYVTLLTKSIGESYVNNLLTIYQQFRTEFPKSRYIRILDPEIRKIADRLAGSLTEKMKFIDSTGTMQTWEEVLALFKGKTVLVDMWGTWCGPCRQEMDKNGSALKSHFANKPLEFLYIANFDMGKQKEWKQLIRYFNLEGTHIMANEGLTKNIMDKVKGTGYPTYIVIHKDGTFELSKADYPMKREVLIKQLEEAIAK